MKLIKEIKNLSKISEKIILISGQSAIGYPHFPRCMANHISAVENSCTEKKEFTEESVCV